MHVGIEIAEIGVIIRTLIVDFPAELATQTSAKCGFARSDIAGDGDVFNWGIAR